MKTYSFGDLRKQFKDMYLVVRVVGRDERGFADKFGVVGSAKSKREIEKIFPEVKEKYPDAYIHQTFRSSGNCFRFRMIDNVLTKLPAFSASECAEMFRQYYNIQV